MCVRKMFVSVNSTIAMCVIILYINPDLIPPVSFCCHLQCLNILGVTQFNQKQPFKVFWSTWKCRLLHFLIQKFSFRPVKYKCCYNFWYSINPVVIIVICIHSTTYALQRNHRDFNFNQLKKTETYFRAAKKFIPEGAVPHPWTGWHKFPHKYLLRSCKSSVAKYSTLK